MPSTPTLSALQADESVAELAQALPLLHEPLVLLAALAFLVAIAEVLCRRTLLRGLGSALTVIVLAALAANLGLIPTYGNDGGLYDVVFGDLAPLAIFWLLLGVDLRSIRRAGGPMLTLFLVGAVGTVLGVLCGMWVVGGPERFGEYGHALGGMFVGTYIGGSANYNAVAIEYGVPAGDNALYVGATVVDAAMTTVWMILGALVPRLFGAGKVAKNAEPNGAPPPFVDPDAKRVGPIDLALALGLGLFALHLARISGDWIAPHVPLLGSSTLQLSIFAIVLAQVPAIQRMAAPRPLGMFSVLVFLAVIGALCDVSQLVRLGSLGGVLLLFVSVALLVHGALTFGAARLLRIDAATASVASQANVGGGTSALALARALGRDDLVLPSILVGSLGTALGNLAGFAVAAWLA